MVLLGYYHSLLHSLPAAIFAAQAGGISLKYLPLLSYIPIILNPGAEIWKTLFLYSMLMGSVYIINQITDAKTDDINNKLYLVAQGHVKLKFIKAESIILLLGVIVLTVCWFTTNYVYFLLVLLSIILGMAYSVPPVRLKGKPILDLLSNSVGFGVIAFAVGWTTNSEFSMQSFIISLPYIFCVGAGFVNTTLLDLKGDENIGDKTIGVLLGVKKSCILSTFLLATSLVLSLILKNYIALSVSLLCLPLFIYMTLTHKFSAITMATKSGILLLSLFIAILIPYYFLLLVGTLLVVRWYYLKRFGIKYPF
jgi:chlorophyll synthase